VPILTAAEYRTLTGRSTAQAPDGQYDALCDAAGRAVEAYCKRAFEQATVVEYYCGTGTRAIALRRRPVLSVTEVRYDPKAYWGNLATSFDSTSVLAKGDDWALDTNDTGLLVRVTGDWPEYPRRREWFRLARDLAPNFGDVKVTYTGGYDPVPADVKLAAAMLVTRSAQLLQFGGPLESERLGEWSYTILNPRHPGTAPDLASVRALLAKYRESPW
jgi:hypothetical protein